MRRGLQIVGRRDAAKLERRFPGVGEFVELSAAGKFHLQHPGLTAEHLACPGDCRRDVLVQRDLQWRMRSFFSKATACCTASVDKLNQRATASTSSRSAPVRAEVEIRCERVRRIEKVRRLRSHGTHAADRHAACRENRDELRFDQIDELNCLVASHPKQLVLYQRCALCRAMKPMAEPIRRNFHQPCCHGQRIESFGERVRGSHARILGYSGG